MWKNIRIKVRQKRIGIDKMWMVNTIATFIGFWTMGKLCVKFFFFDFHCCCWCILHHTEKLSQESNSCKMISLKCHPYFDFIRLLHLLCRFNFIYLIIFYFRSVSVIPIFILCVCVCCKFHLLSFGFFKLTELLNG